ncbi:MAG: CRISPR-associated helicase Cas3' [Deltaproteobacteria bacterium]|nr:MAG: CRISPR-associated helicase Cas3' [Deltaproteobacteria bacterium]
MRNRTEVLRDDERDEGDCNYQDLDHKVKMNQRDFQQKAIEALEKIKPVLIVAPTGLGKTRAALSPFAQGPIDILEKRLIYSLPLRALARGVMDECKSLGLKPVIHHGDEPESRFFSERVVITTVDQYFTAFAGAPLSWASHLSHAAAGAVLTSYSVFDEVHLLSPQRGLQLLFGILRLRRRWGLLSCVMTATLPPSVIESFGEFCGLERIEASPSDIEQRDGWRKVRLELMGHWTRSSGRKGKKREIFEWGDITPERLCEIVREKWDNWYELELDGPKKVIIFVNTVDRAIQVYQKIKEAGFCSRVLLAHSRFTKRDRHRVEEDIQTYFGRNACPNEAILVTTQVAEAGLNISAPLVVTELCPMDSLIQRVGRCQRFKPKPEREMKGKALVVKPEGEGWFTPYSDRIRLVKTSKDKKGKEKRNFSKQFPAVELSRAILERDVGNGLLLDWEKEQDLIKKALDRLYRSYLAGTTDVEFHKDEEPFQMLYRKHRSKKRAEEEEESPEGEEGVEL